MRSGIVLAGGRGRRLGRPKAGVVVAGETLLARAVGLLAARCDEVVVVGRHGVDLPPAPGARTVVDGPGPQGPLTGLVAGLHAAGGDEVLVLACDLPDAGPALDALLAVAPPAAAVDEAGRLQPLCGRYERRAALAAAEAALAAGRMRLTGLAGALGAAEVPAPPGSLRNVNTPADL